ncbi:MAG: hypothetical protein ACE5J2_04945 [Nitrososphaerales archaeon]
MKIGLGFAVGGTIIGISIALAVPFSPWIKPEITESAKVITFNEGRCAVETESKNVIHIDNCDDKNVGDPVTIKYRATTSVGELMP